MQDNSAMTLLGYLYDQIDMLSTLDLSDSDKVDAACRVNKAVNDTSRSILGVADLSIRAMGSAPSLGRLSLISGFFNDGGGE